MTRYVKMLFLGVLLATACKSAGTKTQANAPVEEPPPALSEAPPDGGVDGAPAPVAEAAPPPKPVEAKAKPVEAKARPKSGKHEIDGRKLVMVGQGPRVKDGDKLYDLQMWIDETDGRRAFPALAMRAGGRDKAKLVRGDHAPAFLVWGRFNKQAVFKFAKAVPAATLREDIKSALEEVHGGPELLELVGDAAAGDEWLLTTRDNGEIELRMSDTSKEVPPNPKLQRALWNVWLGPKPLSVELRQHLIEKIDVLNR